MATSLLLSLSPSLSLPQALALPLPSSLSPSLSPSVPASWSLLLLLWVLCFFFRRKEKGKPNHNCPLSLTLSLSLPSVVCEFFRVCPNANLMSMHPYYLEDFSNGRAPRNSVHHFPNPGELGLFAEFLENMKHRKYDPAQCRGPIIRNRRM